MPNPLDLDKLEADLTRYPFLAKEEASGLIKEVKRLRAEQLVCDQALLRIREHADITALIAKRASDLRKAAR